jgi:hypothetical protein
MSMESKMGKKTWLVISFVFLIVNVVIFAFSKRDYYISVDSSAYIDAAKHLITNGSYESSMRLPLYPVFLSVLMFLFGAQYATYAIITQIGMLYLTGVIVYRITEAILPKYGVYGLVFTVFNIPALLWAHSLLPDAVFSFIFILHVLFLVQCFKNQSYFSSLLLGVCVGFLAIARGNGQYFLAFTPLLLLFAFLLFKPRSISLRRAMLIIVLTITSSACIVIPWIIYNRRDDPSNLIITRHYRDYTIREMVVAAHVCMNPLNYKQQDSMHGMAETIGEKAFKLENKPNNNSSRKEEYQVVSKHAKTLVMQNSIGKILTSIGVASSRFLFENGFTKVWIMFDLDTTFWKLTTLVFSATIVLMLRVLAFVGLIHLFKSRKGLELLLLVSMISIIMVTSAFLGSARYRLPVDPLFFTMACFGIYYLRQRFPGGHRYDASLTSNGI